MMERSPAAMLTRSLLVRKGAAAPTAPVPPPILELAPAPTPREPAPHLMLIGREPSMSAARPHTERNVNGPGDSRRRITLRLDPVRHRRLKLAATHLGTSLQDVLIAALDSHLARVAPGLGEGGCPCLSGTARSEEAAS